MNQRVSGNIIIIMPSGHSNHLAQPGASGAAQDGPKRDWINLSTQRNQSHFRFPEYIEWIIIMNSMEVARISL